MIKIKYSPFGLARTDWEAKDIVRNIKEYIEKGFEPGIHIANELIILAIRVAVKKKEINYKDVCFEFNKQILTLNEDARFIEPFPDDFCGHTEKYLIELVDLC